MSNCVENVNICVYNSFDSYPHLFWTTEALMKKYYTHGLRILIIIFVLSILLTIPFALAAESDSRYYMRTVVNTGLDNGFSGSSTIGSSDPHWNWTLGEFYVDGFTRSTTDAQGNVVFLKNVGDTVTLWFDLQQDIDKLNGNDKLSISYDGNGSDQYFQVPSTSFGRGALIIRHTDYQNHKKDPVIYTDFLAANASGSAAVEVEFFEEGDYEVALNYEIIEHKLDIFGWDPIPEYHNYRIFFRFSVRNGNCMVYPFDVTTGAELSDSSLTENGFYLDLAKSRYLDVDIKKTMRAEGVEGLVEDTRFNKPAKDGEQFTDEGVYTITVRNKYTNQTTTKVIYVGTDDVLKAHVVTGLPISNIEYQLSKGATVAADGTIIPAMDEQINSGDNDNQDADIVVWPFVAIGLVVTAIIMLFFYYKKRRPKFALEDNVVSEKTAENSVDGGASE